jgi:isoleucyl-tRNA synthetase
VGKNILKQMSDVYRKIRNTARFLIGNLHDFDPGKDAISHTDLPELDRYMLHRMTEVFAEVTDAYETYEFFRVFQAVQNFCVVDLSNFYLDIAKDRLYISAPDDFRRRSCQTVLAIALENLARAIAPVLSHMAEDIWQALPYEKSHSSIFAAGWVKPEESWSDVGLAQTWTQIRQVRQEVNKVLEAARAAKMIGSSLEAKVQLYVPDAGLRQTLADLNPAPGQETNGIDELRYLFLASQVELLDSPDFAELLQFCLKSDTLTVGVSSAQGEKCDRCWNYSEQVGTSIDHPLLCERCVDVIESLITTGQLAQAEDGSWHPS